MQRNRAADCACFIEAVRRTGPAFWRRLNHWTKPEEARARSATLHVRARSRGGGIAPFVRPRHESFVGCVGGCLGAEDGVCRYQQGISGNWSGHDSRSRSHRRCRSSGCRTQGQPARVLCLALKSAPRDVLQGLPLGRRDERDREIPGARAWSGWHAHGCCRPVQPCCSRI